MNHAESWKKGGRNAGRLAARLAVFAALWWVLTEGDGKAPAVAGLFVLAAALAAMALHSPWTWRIHAGGLVRFLPVFFWNSFIGGMDVALRAMRPRMPINPGLMVFRLRLQPQMPAAVFYIDVLNLLPGTLCAEIEGSELTIHLVDRESAAEKKLRHLEDVVARMFGESIPALAQEKPRG